MLSPNAPLLSLRNVRKTFPGVVAVDGVSLDLRAGEIHALVGENGAGKSTLCAIAYGELAADSGTVERNATAGLVHQHFELAGRLRVWENVVLGREPRRGPSIDVTRARESVRSLAAENGLDVDVDAFVDDLAVGERQSVELLRELGRDPRVLLLDEPTAALAPAEVAALFETLGRLATRGAAVMIVTHKLAEVIGYAHRASVIRGGRIVASASVGDTSARALAEAMVGGSVAPLAARETTALAHCVRVERLSTDGDAPVRDVSFAVRAGEIVGIAGVEGNGQSALADALSGAAPYRGTLERPAATAIVPQDRQREGLVLNWPVVDNVMLGRRRAYRKGWTLDMGRARREARMLVADYGVRTPSIETAVKFLSGGNQQKIVVGRALIDRPAFVIAYNPTRGVDVGAAALVQSRLMQARNDGAAVLLISFDLDEILSLSDRVLVLYRGTVAETFEGDAIDRAAIGRLMAGGTS